MFANDVRLTPKAYFQSVIRAMEMQGFVFLTWVTLNSHTNKYHVPVKGYVRTSFLFFVVPHKTLMVELEFHEELDFHGDETFKSYWSGKVVFAYSWEKMLKEACTIAFAAGKTSDDVETFHPVDFIETSGIFHTFGSMSSHYYERVKFEGQFNLDPSRSADPITFCPLFGQIYQELREYLYGSFIKLHRDSLEPTYEYPEAGTVFWERFNLTRFNDLRVARRLE